MILYVLLIVLVISRVMLIALLRSDFKIQLNIVITLEITRKKEIILRHY